MYIHFKLEHYFASYDMAESMYLVSKQLHDGCI